MFSFKKLVFFFEGISPYLHLLSLSEHNIDFFLFDSKFQDNSLELLIRPS